MVCRGCSEPLQRAIVDFGADAPAARIPQKLKEHYGIEVSASTCWPIVLRHAATIDERPKAAAKIPARDGVEQLIGEIDGSMIPVVETAESDDQSAKVDRRKTRRVGWREARLSLVHAPGSVTPVFGATVGPPDQVGETLLRTAVQAGLGRKTKVHAVSDGAAWIADQVSEQFGLQGHFLVDFYHVCDYLTAAGDTIAGTAARAWLETQKDRLKQNRLQDVVEELQRFVEDDTVPDANAPVRAAHRYLTNRPGQFNYQDALVAGLPIGSGEIESAHRYVIQDRLKRAGAWWKLKNAKHMLALRVYRANQEWDRYWQSRRQQAA
ncbi:MAG: ISKra4 family transposase [Accumulibacter sp.]|uniref:ISKra4 family transposase n=1 Tax=Accumulibacter sp. TaxID=2053492 RepID=UPI002FC36F37